MDYRMMDDEEIDYYPKLDEKQKKYLYRTYILCLVGCMNFFSIIIGAIWGFFNINLMKDGGLRTGILIALVIIFFANFIFVETYGEFMKKKLTKIEGIEKVMMDKCRDYSQTKLSDTEVGWVLKTNPFRGVFFIVIAIEGFTQLVEYERFAKYLACDVYGMKLFGARIKALALAIFVFGLLTFWSYPLRYQEKAAQLAKDNAFDETYQMIVDSFEKEGIDVSGVLTAEEARLRHNYYVEITGDMYSCRIVFQNNKVTAVKYEIKIQDFSEGWIDEKEAQLASMQRAVINCGLEYMPGINDKYFKLADKQRGIEKHNDISMQVLFDDGSYGSMRGDYKYPVYTATYSK